MNVLHSGAINGDLKAGSLTVAAGSAHPRPCRVRLGDKDDKPAAQGGERRRRMSAARPGVRGRDAHLPALQGDHPRKRRRSARRAADHLRFDAAADRRGAALRAARRSKARCIAPDDGAFEYTMVLVIRNERGEEIGPPRGRRGRGVPGRGAQLQRGGGGGAGLAGQAQAETLASGTTWGCWRLIGLHPVFTNPLLRSGSPPLRAVPRSGNASTTRRRIAIFHTQESVDERQTLCCPGGGHTGADRLQERNRHRAERGRRGQRRGRHAADAAANAATQATEAAAAATGEAVGEVGANVEQAADAAKQASAEAAADAANATANAAQSAADAAGEVANKAEKAADEAKK